MRRTVIYSGISAVKPSFQLVDQIYRTLIVDVEHKTRAIVAVCVSLYSEILEPAVKQSGECEPVKILRRRLGVAVEVSIYIFGNLNQPVERPASIAHHVVWRVYLIFVELVEVYIHILRAAQPVVADVIRENIHLSVQGQL